MERVAYFIDSLYKGYPFGSILLWRTRNQLNHERNLGPYVLPERAEDFPVDYVLDGQQRITSIFAVFQNEMEAQEGPDWLPIYFDLRADANAQDSQFLALPKEDADPARYFPMCTIFDAQSYREASSSLSGPDVALVDELNTRFKELQLPVQYFETEERAKVAIVFERVNRLGVKLDTLQLLTAWTWSEEFDLQERFRDLSEALSEAGFSDVGDDANLVLRCTAAVLRGDLSAESLITLNGADVRNGFPRVENGIKGAVDFLRQQMHVETIDNLPYPALIVPLSVFFAEPEGKQVTYTDATLKRLSRWFWRACYAGRYSGQTLRAARADIEQINNLKQGYTSTLGDFGHQVEADFFMNQGFRVNSASSKTFILTLAQYRPRSFISGAEVALGTVLQSYNRSEFHHIFPRKFLLNGSYDEARINALANFCFLNRAENNRIGGRAPSEYRRLMPSDAKEILDSALVPAVVFGDEYEQFLEERSALLVAAARGLMGDNPDPEGHGQEKVD